MPLQPITRSLLNTPIGEITVEVTDLGLRLIQLSSSMDEKILTLPPPATLRVVKSVGPQSEINKRVINWIFSFFERSSNPLPLPPIDNPIVARDNFTGLVLRTLMRDTQPGDRLSYAELAQRCGRPKACRAVGQAMRANPVPLVVPCHRVVGSNGKLGHYMSGRGDNIKVWLLEMEKQKPESL